MNNLLKILKNHFGFDHYRKPQQSIIERTLSGKHSLVIMPTGAGKSLTYQIPALLMSDLTIVISPLIALMKDQVDILLKRKIDATFINSSLFKTEREKRYKNIIQGKYKILYITPERFRIPEFKEIIIKRTVSLLAVDEAHCISEWGHDFRPDYTRLKEIRKILDNPPTIALTATATPDVQKDIIKQLGLENEDVKIFHEGIDRPNLFLEVNHVWGEQQKLKMIKEVIKSNPGNGIIYFALIKNLQSMSDRFIEHKIRHLIYHGDLASGQRKSIQERFMQGQNNIVLATNAFGMGIDKENIRFVVHAEIPASLEAYYQEIGRAGRDEKPSTCSLLYDEQDLNIQLEFIKWNNPSAAFYQYLFNLLLSNTDRVNAEGIEYVKEQLIYKNKHDYRLETALGMLDRFDTVKGDIESKNLHVISDLPEKLIDQNYLDIKLKKEQQKLYQMVLYTKKMKCRKAFIHHYFGLNYRKSCGACDCEKK